MKFDQIKFEQLAREMAKQIVLATEEQVTVICNDEDRVFVEDNLSHAMELVRSEIKSLLS